jgi:hypothetical protein
LIPKASEEGNVAKLALTFYSVLRMPIADILQCARAAEEAGFGFICGRVFLS